jgi:xanthine dehydrogenase accessory factor
MTKEISNIIQAFKIAQQEGRQTALATVVLVEGSSYRRPGARMLVEDNGKMTGAISGGCLEGDAFKKAMVAVKQQQNKLVTYNTIDEDVEFGVQLGCNGIVHILFEPVDPADSNNPVALLEKFYLETREIILVTLFSLKNTHATQPGTCFFFDGERTISKIEDKDLEKQVKENSVTVLSHGNSLIQQYPEVGLTALVELLQPPVSLVVVGAGNDALPLIEMAAILGWQITVIDGRSSHATRQRFSKAHKIVVGKPAEAIKQVVIDGRTAFVLMTHNYNYDLAMMRVLVETKCKYIGTLGPKKRLSRMLAELEEQGQVITSEQETRIYGPTGLDIGAEAAEEIALSILAEIKAVITMKRGTFLREKPGEIHPRSELKIDETKPGKIKTG